MTELALPRPQTPAGLPFRVFNDARLARMAADGDDRAFSAIYERHQQGVYRYCLSILRHSEDASDALQATMTKALLAIPAKRPEVPFRPWLYRIAHNEAISVQRRRTADPTLAEDRMSPGADEEAAARRELRELVDDLLALPERQRTALVMRELNGLGFEEIGVALGSSAGAAKQTIYEARVALHERQLGRRTSCARVALALSDGDRRVLRSRRITAHLKSCATCREFEQTMRLRAEGLAAFLPPMAGLGGGGLVKALLGGSGGGGGGVAGTFAGLSGGGATVASATALKSATALAALVIVAGTQHAGGDHPARTASGGASAAPPASVSFASARARIRAAEMLVADGRPRVAVSLGEKTTSQRSAPIAGDREPAGRTDAPQAPAVTHGPRPVATPPAPAEPRSPSVAPVAVTHGPAPTPQSAPVAIDGSPEVGAPLTPSLPAVEPAPSTGGGNSGRGNGVVVPPGQAMDHGSNGVGNGGTPPGQAMDHGSNGVGNGGTPPGQAMDHGSNGVGNGGTPPGQAADPGNSDHGNNGHGNANAPSPAHGGNGKK